MSFRALLVFFVVFATTASAQPMPDKVTLVKVTTLEDSGAGSLRECVSKAFPRACLFEVSGRIKLKSNLEITQPDLIVAGQTAPSPGILITNATVRVKARNVTLEHLTMRVGDDKKGPSPRERDTLSVQTNKAQNVTLRNLSVSWAIDENLSTYGPVKDVRIEDCIISEALYRSLHPKGPHSMGALVGETARNISFVGNLFAANNDRNPRWKFDTTGEMINNVIYGWGGTTSWNITNLSDIEDNDKPTFLDVIGNVYIPGPGGTKKPTVVFAQETSSNSLVYMDDNLAPGLTNLDTKNISPSRVGGSTPEEVPASQTLDAVLKNAGSRPWDRSQDDARVIDGVRARTLAIRDQVGAWPTVAENVARLALPAPVLTLSELDAFLAPFEHRVPSPSPTPVAQPTQAQQTATPTATASPTVTVNAPVQSTPNSATPTPLPTAPPTRSPDTRQAPPQSTIVPPKTRGWIRSRKEWKSVNKHLCCSRSGWRELRDVAHSYPSIVNRCEALACSQRMPWRSKIFNAR